MEDKNDRELNLVLSYSIEGYQLIIAKKEFNSTEHHPVDTLNVIYYNWLIDITKKIENLKVIFTFTRGTRSTYNILLKMQGLFIEREGSS